MIGVGARRALAVGAFTAILWLASVVGAAPVRATVSQARTYPAHLLVYAQEWSLWPSRTKVPAGTVDVQFWNRGQDAHDVQVRRLNAANAMVGAVLGRVSATPSGDIHSAVWHLKTGRYEIYCSMPGHLAMGMHARITVAG